MSEAGEGVRQFNISQPLEIDRSQPTAEDAALMHIVENTNRVPFVEDNRVAILRNLLGPNTIGVARETHNQLFDATSPQAGEVITPQETTENISLRFIGSVRMAELEAGQMTDSDFATITPLLAAVTQESKIVLEDEANEPRIVAGLINVGIGQVVVTSEGIQLIKGENDVTELSLKEAGKLAGEVMVNTYDLKLDSAKRINQCLSAEDQAQEVGSTEKEKSRFYGNINHSLPLQGDLLHDFLNKLKYRSERPLSPPEEGKLKYEVRDRLYYRSLYNQLTSIDLESGLAFDVFDSTITQAQPLISTRPIEYKLYEAQEEEDEFTASLLKALKAAGADSLLSTEQVISASRIIVVEKMYDEFLALQTGQVDVIRERLISWQKEELESFVEDIEREQEAKNLGIPTYRINGQEFFHLRGLNVESMGARYLQMADEFAYRTHKSPIDYVEEIELESAKQTFLNAVKAYEPIARANGTPQKSTEEILKEIADKNNLSNSNTAS